MWIIHKFIYSLVQPLSVKKSFGLELAIDWFVNSEWGANIQCSIIVLKSFKIILFRFFSVLFTKSTRWDSPSHRSWLKISLVWLSWTSANTISALARVLLTPNSLQFGFFCVFVFVLTRLVCLLVWLTSIENEIEEVEEEEKKEYRFRQAHTHKMWRKMYIRLHHSKQNL